MNIQKCRLAAILTVMLTVCMMVATMIVPASAAEIHEEFLVGQFYITDTFMADLHSWMCGCSDTTHLSFGPNAKFTGLYGASGSVGLYLDTLSAIQNMWGSSPDWYLSLTVWMDSMGQDFYIVPINLPAASSDLPAHIEYCSRSGDDVEYTPDVTFPKVEETVPDETDPPEVIPPEDVDPPTDNNNLGFAEVVTPDLFNQVLDEIVTLLPVVIPVMIGFIALRKGISFLQNVLHSA